MKKRELLTRIYSDKKRKEIEEILHMYDPPHFERVRMVGFLRYAVGMTIDEVCQLIAAENQWSDYDPYVTKRQVASIRKSTVTEQKMKAEYKQSWISPSPSHAVQQSDSCGEAKEESDIYNYPGVEGCSCDYCTLLAHTKAADRQPR